MICARFLFVAPLLAAALTTAHAVPAPRVAESAAMDLLEFQIDGNTVLPAVAVERAVYRFLGPGKSFADLEKARQALELAYHEAGYLTVVVDIPEQQVSDGSVSLRVTEGRVERLKVADNRYTSRSAIRAEIPALAPGAVPNFSDVQQELARAQRADRKLTPLLRPGKAPGTVEVELKVDDDLPLHGSVEYNNKQSPDTTRDRLEASLRYDNLWQKGHSAGFSFQGSPKKSDEVEVWTGTYSAPLGAGTLAAYAVKSNSNLATAASSTVLGKGTTLGLRYIRPLPGRGSFFHSLTAGADYKDFKETTNLLGADTTNRPLRYVPFVLQYTAGQQDDGGLWQFNFGTTWSLRDFSDRDVLCDDGLVHDQFDCKRSGARSNFAVLRGDVQRTQALGAGWDLLARLDFQVASQPLVSNEQFSAGGVDSVRGYLDAERQGDDGLRARFELRTPGLLADTRFDARLVGFFDWADLRVQEALPRQEARVSLGSYGIGVRLRDNSGLRLFADMARASRNGAGAPGGGWRTAKNDTRMHMRLAYEF